MSTKGQAVWYVLGIQRHGTSAQEVHSYLVEAVDDSQLWKCVERAANQTGNDARAES